MKKMTYAVVALLAAILFSCCKADDAEASANLTLTKKALAFLAEGDTQTFGLRSDAAWKATDIPEWVELTPTAGEATKAITLRATATANTLKQERTANITISSGTETATIELRQLAATTSENSQMRTATQIASQMYAGVNIGNTMEACDNVKHVASETMWGNPLINETYIRGLKALGFNAVRIPCAWDYHIIDKQNYTLDPAWLDRVSEVVGYCTSNDMYCFVNIHWDGGWLEESVAEGYSQFVDDKQRALWTQIATALRDYDDHLMLAACNEPGQQSQASIGSTAINALLRYEQTFVDAVRATGGNNAERCLIVQAPFTNIDKAVSGEYTMPTDVVSDRMMVEIHFYDPANFCIVGQDQSWGRGSWYWGEKNMVSGSDRNSTWADEAYIAQQFRKMYTRYASKGIPVILGEYSSTIRTPSEFPGLDEEKHKASRAAWNEVVTREAKKHGCVPFYWETGGDVNRTDGTARNAYAIDGLMRGAAAGAYPWTE